MAKLYDNWRVVRSLGEGGQAHVFVVVENGLEGGAQYVLKRLKNVDSQARRERFEREVAATRNLKHRNILRILEANLENREPYYIAEYCAGGSLADIRTRDRFKGRITETIHIMVPIADALATAHRAGIVHRDVKPQNILLRADGTPVLGDFGICFVEQGTPLTLSGEAMGSLNFMAPEMESGSHEGPTAKADVYSLGKVLYWMLSGGRVFARENHRRNSLVQLLSDERFEHVHALLDHMIVEDPSARFSAEEMERELTMTDSLVSGDFAPLTPSAGIRCRFCGKGLYERYVTSRNPDNPTAYHSPAIRNQLGWDPTGVSDVRVLRCNHCGHIQAFQFDGIQNTGWWKR